MTEERDDREHIEVEIVDPLTGEGAAMEDRPEQPERGPRRSEVADDDGDPG